MKRFLFFNDSMAMGGTEKLLVNLLNHLAAKDCKLTLLLPEPNEQNILLKGIPASVSVKYLYKENTSHLKKKIGENTMIFFPSIFNKWKSVNASDYDEIICFKETFFARIFSKMNKPKILWIHNMLYKRRYESNTLREKLSVFLNKKQLKIAQRAYNTFDKVICVSDAAKNAYIEVLHEGKVPKQDIRILYNAIDLTSIVEKSKAPIKDLPQGELNFLLLTRTSPEKRTDRFVNVASRLKREGYNFHVFIIGDGINSPIMKTSLKECDIDDKITLMGRTENPYPYILQCNWSLCVSERESFSLSLLESMALKTPVITTDCGGPRDIVDGGKFGLLVENSTEGIYSGMKSVLDDPTLSVKYSAELDKAISRFDYKGWLNSIDKLLNV